MDFTWDESKRRRNLKKHGLDFADAEQVFSGPTMTLPDGRFDYGEARFSTYGMLDGDVVMLAYTEIESEIHIIHMRRAERYERENFFSSIG